MKDKVTQPIRKSLALSVNNRAKTLLIFLFFGHLIYGQSDVSNGLQTETLLHPADGFTAFTLKKGEFVYNQSPFTLPFPSWAWLGITDYITAEIDLLPLIGGLFQEPHLPVPSFNFRFKLMEQDKLMPSIAFETMYQHLWNEVIQSEQANAIVSRKGNSWYNHFNLSWKMNNRFYTHLSFGVTYVENLYFSNNDSLKKIEKFYPKSFTPDVNLSFDYRWKPWISLHTTGSYGTTFVYLDNIPRKQQISYGFRVAPFYKNRRGILRTLRAEFIAYYINIPDIKESIASILPIFPYFYWQWTIKGKKNKRIQYP